MSGEEVYKGYCLNGPLKGQKLISQTPWHRVALMSEPRINLSPIVPTLRTADYRHVRNMDGDGDWWIVERMN